MKKSFIMTVAVSMALSAVATETGYISGTSFEDISLDGNSSVELVKDANDAGVVDNVCYWSTDAWKTENSADYEGFFVVTNISGDTSYPESRPEYWNGKYNSNALVIDTDKPLYRRINPVISMDNSTARTLDTKGVFFDSVVQFTATDVSPTPVGIDKLLVWLYTSPEDVATNPDSGLFKETEPITTLVVTAGYYKENDNTLYTTNYCVAADDVSIKPDEWHRLTIKAFISNDGKHALFNVYVDGKKVSTEDGESDFISLKDNLTSIPDIIGVAFDGKGMVDDIAFTTTAPDFANEGGTPVETFVLNVALSDTTNARLLAIHTNNGPVEIVNGSYILEMGVDNVKAYVECDSGYKVSNSQATYDSDEGYWIIPIDVTSATADGTLNVMISVEVDAAGVPTIDGVPVTDNDFSAANSGSAIKVPTTWTKDGQTLKNGNTAVYTFESYYDVALDGGTVTLTLNESARPVISETATDEGDAIVVTDNAVALGVTNAKPGLWYGAWAYDDVACAEANKIGEEATGWVQAESGKPTVVTVEKPKKLTVVLDKAFFRVVVDDKDHTTPAEQN